MTESEAYLAKLLVLVQICLGGVVLIGIWAGIGLILDFIGQRFMRWWKGRRPVRVSRREKAP